MIAGLAPTPPAPKTPPLTRNDDTAHRQRGGARAARKKKKKEKKRVRLGGERPLSDFADLPRSWQQQVLRRCGGTGDETIETLQVALSPAPTTTALMAIASKIESGRGHGREAKRLSPSQESIVAQAADHALQFLDDFDVWKECRPLKAIAEEVARRTANLKYVDDVGLGLLTADDDELLAVAEKRVEMARRRKGVHPSYLDAPSVRRRLRLVVNRAAIHAASVLGLIGGPKELRLPPYADDWTLRRFRDQRTANQNFLRAHDMVRTDTADVVSLIEISASKEAARRAMWYALILGIRDIAKRDGLAPIFVSVTLPGEWHLHPEFGVPGDPQHSPAEGSVEIGKRWHKVLALFRKRGGRVVGIRVAEPHTDGTAHLHCVLWLSPIHIDHFCECLGKHIAATTEKESKARQRNDYTKGPALVVRRWEDRAQGDPRGNADAASYALHYVLDVLRSARDPKEHIEQEEEALRELFCDEEETQRARAADNESERAGAWARHIRCRRLSLVGFAPGTIGRWEKIYAEMKAADREGRCVAEPRARAVAHAMRRHQWGTALRLLGAFSSPHEPRLASLREETKNRWGDKVLVTTAYFHPVTGEVSALARPHKWRMEKRPEPNSMENQQVSVIQSYPSAAPRAPPQASPDSAAGWFRTLHAKKSDNAGHGTPEVTRSPETVESRKPRARNTEISVATKTCPSQEPVRFLPHEDVVTEGKIQKPLPAMPGVARQ